MARDTRGVRPPPPRTRREGRRGIRHNRLIDVRRLLAVVLGLALLAGVVATSASAALFFLFSPGAAKPGDVVKVRLGGTSTSFTLADREKPFRRAMRIYLVPNGIASEVTSRFDPRLHFVGILVPDRNGRGVLSFRAPPLDTASYAVAAWCPQCARWSLGKTFFVLDGTQFTLSRYPRMLLRLRMPDATRSCPVTTSRSRDTGMFTYGNGLLSSTPPPSGVVVAGRYEPDGSLFWKPGWLPHGVVTRELTVKGERLDAPSPPMRVLAVRWGGGSWRTASTFPSEGCWRVTGRLGDIALSYVVKVVAA